MNTDEPEPLHAFGGYGIELEYMIVNRDSLSVLPVADRLLHEATGSEGHEVRRGMLGWSNELALHVIEVKNIEPVPTLAMLPEAFQSEVRHIDRLLEAHGATLMPTAMHPWMDPLHETHLWPHDNAAIYRSYDRIFNSKSHGWSNLQSMHINLPFAGDKEFSRLHAAIRLVLPILPALAASSPIAEGRDTGWADYRMRVYADNSKHIPSITGMLVPETVTSRAAYEQKILALMYRDIERYDTERVLHYEWLNSRGAIARFDRNAIEIRVIDTQECPRADLAIAAAASSVVRSLYRERKTSLVEQQEVPTNALAAILQECIRDAERTVIGHAEYLRQLGFPDRRGSAQEVWAYLIDEMQRDDPVRAGLWDEPLRVILKKGPLARRILQAVEGEYSRPALHSVYGALCRCLEEGKMFSGV